MTFTVTLHDPELDQDHALQVDDQKIAGQLMGQVRAVLDVPGTGLQPVVLSVCLGPLPAPEPDRIYQQLGAWLSSLARACVHEMEGAASSDTTPF